MELTSADSPGDLESPGESPRTKQKKQRIRSLRQIESLAAARLYRVVNDSQSTRKDSRGSGENPLLYVILFILAPIQRVVFNIG